jgi:hypothetical protein
MAAGKYSFVIEQGATFQTELQYVGPNGDPIDLTDTMVECKFVLVQPLR